MPNDDLRNSETALRELKRSFSAPNFLTLVIQGHFTVERFLVAAIEDRLHAAPDLDMERLPFSIKAELGGALSCVSADSLPLFRVFNKIRNRFAHNPFTTFSDRDASDMKNCFSTFQKKVVEHSHKKVLRDFSEVETLHWSTIAMCSELRHSMMRKLREKISHELSKKEVEETLEEVRKQFPVDEWNKEFEEKINREAKRFIGETD
jgi:hypothetical protein